MQDNKNLIMASVAIIGVVLAALIIFLPKDGKKVENIKLENVKVYKHHDKTENKEGYYSECHLSTEDVVKVRNGFNKIIELGKDNLVSGKHINGDYKVIIEDKFIAFDKDHNNIVYFGNANVLFKYKSEIYDLIVVPPRRAML